MRFRIHLVGRTRESWGRAAEEEYLKRLTPLADVQLVIHRAAPLGARADPAAIRRVEARNLLGSLEEREFPVALDAGGENLASEELARRIGAWQLEGNSRIAVLTGGASGLDHSVLERARLVLSLSRMTFTHQMVRVVLLEQLYRALMVLAGRPYHR